MYYIITFCIILWVFNLLIKILYINKNYENYEREKIMKKINLKEYSNQLNRFITKKYMELQSATPNRGYIVPPFTNTGSDKDKSYVVIFTDGYDEASKVYMNNKKRIIEEVFLNTVSVLIVNITELLFDKRVSGDLKDITHDDQLDLLRKMFDAYNIDSKCLGIMVQLPLKNFMPKELIDFINPNKDIDGLTTINQIRLALSDDHFSTYLQPCTALGIYSLITAINNYIEFPLPGEYEGCLMPGIEHIMSCASESHYGVPVLPLSMFKYFKDIRTNAIPYPNAVVPEDQNLLIFQNFLNYHTLHCAGTLALKKVLIVGRSDLVGRPLARMLEMADATVTLAHSKSDIEHETWDYDYIVLATGITEHFVINNPNAIVIDAGIGRNGDGKLRGDLNVHKSCVKAYTEVPGGVGLLTTSMLSYNIAKAALMQMKNRRMY